MGTKHIQKMGWLKTLLRCALAAVPVPRSNSHRPGAMGLKTVAAAKAASAAAKQAAAQAAMGDAGSALKVGNWKPVVFFWKIIEIY